MRYTYMKLTNYIGIYNGMGLYEIEIDFSRCTHKVCVIKGTNGSGKSTIMNALSIFPDGASSFIPGLNASKIIRILYNGILYEIKFFHDVKNNGTRDVSKAYISKMDQFGNLIEMNPNGNVTQYKDIIYNEFRLDSNFATLSRLSMDDRGIGYMRPAERKKFVNSIIESLENYNSIYRTITKKASNLKAIMTSITSKLGSLGDKDQISQQIHALQEELNQLSAQRDSFIKEVAEFQTHVDDIDPDGKFQQEYDEITTNLSRLSKELKKAIYGYASENRIFIPEVECTILGEKLQYILDEIAAVNTRIVELRASRDTVSSFLTNYAQELAEFDKQIASIKTADYTNAQKSLSNAITKRNEILGMIQCTNIDPNEFTKDEYILALETVHEIVSAIDIFRNCFDYNTINACIDAYRATGYATFPPVKDTDQYQRIIDEYGDNSPAWIDAINDAKHRMGLVKKLENRPEDCSIDSCYFIHDAVEASKGDPEKDYNNAVAFMESKKEAYIEARVSKQECENYNLCLNQIRTIVRSIDKNGAILSRLPNGGIFTSKSDFFERLVSGESFTFIDKIYRYIDLANYYEEYRVVEKEIASLEKMIASIEAKSGSVSQLEDARESLKNRLFALKDELSSIQSSIDEAYNQITILNTQSNDITSRQIPMVDHIIEMMNLETKYNARLEELNRLMGTIRSYIDGIKEKNMEIAKLDTAISIKHKERSQYVLQSNQIEMYELELKDYQAQYDLYDTIRYYSSPTTGIQLVFMQLYMGKILQVSNTLLSYLFNGRYQLQPFIINESEFRIPCLGEGYINDDISSMSSSQLTMISMILSFALLYTSSTEYNIIKLDEIDDPLDEPNRAAFTQLLNQIMDIMRTEQCIMISHSSELIVENSDIILLRSDGISSIPSGNANIIWDFNRI